MSDFERPVWPILAWVSGALLVAMLGMIYLVSFVDGRWAGFLFINILAFVPTTASIFLLGDVTYKRKPRGWRKLRRDRERQAYIEQLERETGISHFHFTGVRK